MYELILAFPIFGKALADSFAVTKLNKWAYESILAFLIFGKSLADSFAVTKLSEWMYECCCCYEVRF
jgi:hypothetical protein